tara:strand:- start:7448 stop:7900 length:453 start_codon:yes stop_codon:yes gene_type:complete
MGYLRKANIADLNHVCKHMRDMDRLEAVYQTGNEPEDALRLSYLSGQQVLAIAGDNDQPMGLCGVISDGCIWMICTDELFSNKKYRIQLIRKGRKWVDKLLQSYKVLYNFVYAENHSAIKWLKALGFTFVNYYEKYGDQEKPFYEFVRIA